MARRDLPSVPEGHEVKTTVHKTDAQLRQDVIDEIERDRRFKPAELGVEVDRGIVTLIGTVSSYAKVTAAADIAADIAGTKGVANELTVHAPDSLFMGDTELAAAIRSALKWDADLPDELIEVIVRHGVVTLKGSVDYWYQRQAAAARVGALSGVVAINNHLVVVAPMMADGDIRANIEKAIARRIPLAARHIKTEVNGGMVRLSGNVELNSDRLQAEKAAWTTEGVRHVENKLIATW
jgi:osmotically-inducible protein OsmY